MSKKNEELIRCLSDIESISGELHQISGRLQELEKTLYTIQKNIYNSVHETKKGMKTDEQHFEKT